MDDFPTQSITIYHKNKKNQYERYVKECSFRNTSMLNQKNYGFTGTDKAIIRIFDTVGYNKSVSLKNTSSKLNFLLNSFIGDTWKIQIGDVIVNGVVEDEITDNTPITTLSQKYGKENILKVTSLNLLIFNDEDIEELNHVKIGAI